jgi:hypothetical protein
LLLLVAFIAASVPFILHIVITIKNSRKGWCDFTREERLARVHFLIAKILQQKIFNAVVVYLTLSLCIASSVRLEDALKKKVMQGATSVINFPANILKTFL